MKKTILYMLATVIGLTMLSAFVPVYADTPYIPQPGTLPGPSEKFQEQGGGAQKALVTTLIPRFTTGSIGMAGGFATLFLIIGGVRYAISYGKEENIENAKKQVIWALVGLLLAMLSYIIVVIIINLEFVKSTT
ncbi:MAG: pilin [Candidatus Gracilibacteria bacterium]|jgi:hypothetical protein